MLKGVKKVLPGYSGGSEDDATYEKVASGRTNHAEVTYVEYDSTQINYRDLLTVFFASHDPTTVNRQGNDVGPQYRSVVFYTTPEQKVEAEKFVAEIPGAVTDVEPFEVFYEAEEYHKDYFRKNQNAPYCQIIINPKLEKVQKEFGRLLKSGS